MSEPTNQSPAIPRPKTGRGVPLLILLGLVILGGTALFAAQRIVHEREMQLTGELERQMRLSLEGRAATLAGWLAGRREAVARFAHNKVVRLHAA